MTFFVFVALFCLLEGISKAWVILLVSSAALGMVILNRVPSYYLCCGVSSFEPVQIEAREIATKQDIYRPTFANPDLGQMSWTKEFNVLDIGMLGSPIFATARQGPLLADYFFDYAAPDLVESHETWSCQYLKTIFLDSRFRQNYTPIRESSTRYGACGDYPLPKGIWIRKDIMKNSRSAERRLIDDMMQNPTASRLEKELADCQKNTNHSFTCTYVARAAFRFLPELRSKGMIEDLNKIFQTSNSKEFDLYLINGYRNAQIYKIALEALVKDYLIAHKNSLIHASSDFLVGVDKGFLVVIKPDCIAEDLKNPIYITYKTYPDGKLRNNLSAPLRDSFNILHKGFRVGSYCMASFELNDAKLPLLNLVGQWIPEQERLTWGVSPILKSK